MINLFFSNKFREVHSKLLEFRFKIYYIDNSSYIELRLRVGAFVVVAKHSTLLPILLNSHCRNL